MSPRTKEARQRAKQMKEQARQDGSTQVYDAEAVNTFTAPSSTGDNNGATQMI